MPDCRLYLITPPVLDPITFAPRLAEALDAGDVACVQLRLKGVDDDTVRRTIDHLRPLVQDRDVAFILNDRPDLAAATGCDGVHIGQDDTPYPAARQQVGADAIVGVSCMDSRHLALEAADAGADYVAFGPFFPTTTKITDCVAGLDLLTWWNDLVEIPVVAIGGITPGNCGPLVHAGANFLAVVSAIWDHIDGPGAAVKAFNSAIAAAEPPAEA
ncbi:MAG: thiamine phosphate synthase [Azospirillaceae bacterium]|nr:thiamine phosphate synthase [Azospirillaceae bacterium]